MKWLLKNDNLLITLGIILVIACIIASRPDPVRDTERQIASQGLSDDREKSRVFRIYNPSLLGLCFEKTEEKPLITIKQDDSVDRADFEECGEVHTDDVIKAGDTVTIGRTPYYATQIFFERLKYDQPSLKLKAGETLCTIVEKSSDLPEYETKGRWFFIKNCRI